MIILLLFLPIHLIFSQSKAEFLGFWILDSKDGFLLLNIGIDSITARSGFCIEGKYDETNKTILSDTMIINYKIISNKMFLNYNNFAKDTLTNINSNNDSLYVWLSDKINLKALLIFKPNGIIKIGGAINNKTLPYSIEDGYLSLIENTGNTRFKFIINHNILKLIPEGFTETLIFNKL